MSDEPKAVEAADVATAFRAFVGGLDANGRKNLTACAMALADRYLIENSDVEIPYLPDKWAKRELRTAIESAIPRIIQDLGG